MPTYPYFILMKDAYVYLIDVNELNNSLRLCCHRSVHNWPNLQNDRQSPLSAGWQGSTNPKKLLFLRQHKRTAHNTAQHEDYTVFSARFPHPAPGQLRIHCKTTRDFGCVGEEEVSKNGGSTNTMREENSPLLQCIHTWEGGEGLLPACHGEVLYCAG